MAETTGQFDQDKTDGAATLSDEVIRRFLLSSLSEDEQARFEASLFGYKDQSESQNEDLNEDLEERVRAAEFELADDYAFERLSAPERELFENKFLVTEGRQRKLEVSAALRSHLTAPAASKKTAVVLSQHSGSMSASERILSWLGFNRPRLGFAIAFALLVVFSGVVWLALRNQRVQEPVIAKRAADMTAKPRNGEPAPLSSTPEIATPEITAPPKSTPKANATPAEPASTSVVATFLLLPNALRAGGEMTRVALPQGEHAIVRLQLALEIDQPGSHRAELLTAEGRPVYVGRKLKTNKTDSTARIVFDVPARLLKSGDYQVKLNWIVAGSATSGGRYYFRVTQ